jgi:hypothetical protein
MGPLYDCERSSTFLIHHYFSVVLMLKGTYTVYKFLIARIF